MHALYASLQDVSSPFRKGYFASMKLFIIGRTGKGVEYQELSVLITLSTYLTVTVNKTLV